MTIEENPNPRRGRKRERPILEPVPAVPPTELKTNYVDPAKRYELAERVVWAGLQKWKQDIIIKCKLTGSAYSLDDPSSGAKADRVIDEYAHEIARLAESETKLADNFPPVPSFTLHGKPQPLTK